MREGMITFPFGLDIVEVLGDGCQHWNKEVPWNEDIVQENRDEGYQ